MTTTSYNTLGGKGFRRSLIDVTTTASVTNPLSNLVDGAKSADNFHGIFCNSAQSGKEFKFVFPFSAYIDEFTWTQSSAVTQGTWSFRGSNDDVTYTDLQTGINLGGASAVDVHTIGTPGFYTFYKLVSTAGTTSASPWIEEVEFKLAMDPLEATGTPVGATSYSNLDGSGARTARVGAFMNVATACGGNDVGNMSGLVDGDTSTQNCTNSTAFTNGTTGVVMQFVFRAPLCIDEFTWIQQSVHSQGTYTLDASIDGITFTTLATGLNIGGTSTTEAHAFTNTNGYHVYRLTQTAGALNSTPWVFETKFKTSELTTPTPPTNPTGTLNTTETTDTLAATGTVSNAGPLAVTEATDVFAGTGQVPYVATMNVTGPTDAMVALVFTPPSGTMAATETGDTWSNSPGFDVLALDTFGTGLHINTTGFDRIIVLGYTDAAIIAGRPQLITSITDSPAGLTWQRRTFFTAGPDYQTVYSNLDVWWAYAHLPIVDSTMTLHVDSGVNGSNTTISVLEWFSVKGLNGNFAYPFADVDNRASAQFGIGAENGTPTNPQLNEPLMTGDPVGGSSGSFAILDMHGNSVIESGGLGVDAIGGGGNGWAMTSSAVNTGRYHIEFTMDNIVSGDYGVGFFYSRGGIVPSRYADGTEGIFLRASDGIVLIDGQIVGSIEPDIPVNGDVISFDIDLDNQLMWVRNVTQSGFYNGPRIQGQPGPEFQGISTHIFDLWDFWSRASAGFGPQPYVAQPFQPAIAIPEASGGRVTVNFGEAAFAGPVPDGFTGGWPGPNVVDPAEPYPAFVFNFTSAQAGNIPPTLTTAPGYVGISNSGGTGSQRAMSMVSQYKLTKLALSGEFQVGGSAVPGWITYGDALKPGQNAPGEFIVTDNADSFSALGFPGVGAVHGELVVTGAADVAAIFGFEPDSGVLAARDTPDVFSAFLSVPANGVLTATEHTDVFAGTGLGRGEDGIWLSTETTDTMVSTGNVPVSGTFTTTENADKFRAISTGVIRNQRRRQMIVA